MPRIGRSKDGHTHQYQLKPYGKKGLKVYACVLPTCPHFQIQKELLIGKASLCNDCGNPFILNALQISREVARPRCSDCREKRPLGGPKKLRKKKDESLDEAISSLRERLNLF